MLLKLDVFHYVMSLNLKMVYYHIQLSKNAIKLCTIILLWGKYQYTCLPMEVASSLDIFQKKMNDLLHRFEFIRAYTDDILILTKGYWKDHVQKP